MLEQNDAIYLGALLHDIGKIAWRSQELKAGDTHEKLGEEFIREHLGKCKAVEGSVETILKAANRETGAIWYADIIAASEREQQASHATRRPLLSIFNRVSIGKAERPRQTGYILPEKEGKEIQFPTLLNENEKVEDWKPDSADMIAKHKQLWDEFLSDLKKLRHIEDRVVFIKSFQSLLEYYTTAVCSAGYKSNPDISLYDHSRITAALSLCKELGNILIIKGDISGIQNFIYSGIRDVKSPAKQLRGRSFFISLLTDTIADYCLEELHLYPSHLFFNAGGHFQIIAPSETAIKDKLCDIEKTINRYLFKKFAGKLNVVIAMVEKSSKELLSHYDEVIYHLNEELAAQKKKKLWSVLEEITAEPISPVNSQEEIIKKIGEQLPKATHLIEVHASADIDYEPKVSFKEFSRTWIFVNNDDLYKKDALGRLKNQSIKNAIVYSIKDYDFLKYSDRSGGLDFPVGFSYKRLGLSIPMKKNEQAPMEFSDLAEYDSKQEQNNSTQEQHNSKKDEKKSKPYPLLGIVRMDVDSLGALFAVGLREKEEKEKSFTISRHAALSRELTKFFTVHINKLAEEHTIYLVYSGGDDVFAVGSWIDVIRFSQKVREDFQKFVCNNKNLTISAGIVFTKENFPISVSALWAGEQEEKAKKFRDSKDCVSIFYRELPWNNLTDLLKWGEELLKVVGNEENTNNDDTLPRSFIHQLLTKTKECFDEETGKPKPRQIQRLNAWLHYSFARRKVNYAELQTPTLGIKTKFAQYILENDTSDTKNIYKNFIIPASYVLLKTRKL